MAVRGQTSMSLAGSDLNLLNALRVLLEERNVTRAGVRLGMSQPSTSGVLARLRRQFNDALLVRNGRELELTPLAAELLPAVQVSVRLMTAVFGREPGFDPATSGRTFRIVASDYALAVLHAPLRRRLAEVAPHVRVEFDNLDDDVRGSDRVMLEHDVLIGPLGFGFPGRSAPFFRDRIVCLVDRDNPRLVDGYLDFAALNDLPHAVATFGYRNLTPIDRVLEEHSVSRRVQLTVWGWLALPFVIPGTDMVAMVPQRIADLFGLAPGTRLVQASSPVGEVDLIEGYWYQPSRAVEDGHRWLRSMLDVVAQDLSAESPITITSRP